MINEIAKALAAVVINEINKTLRAAVINEIAEAFLAVAIDVAAFLGVLTIIFIHALPIVHQGEWAAVFADVVNIDCRSVNSHMIDSLGPHDG